MRILVPGGAGFIGKHVVSAMQKDGHDVHVVDLVHGVHFAHFVPDQAFDATIMLAAKGGAARAAREPDDVCANNVACALNLHRHREKWGRVILASSFSVYGPYCELADEDQALCPLEPYAASKAMQELALTGLDATILRFSSVYGRNMRENDSEATIIAKIAGWIRRGERPIIFEDGKQTRDFVYVEDIIDAMRAILRGEKCPRIVNVCSGHPTSLLEACYVLGKAIGREVTPDVTGHVRTGDMRFCRGSTLRLQPLLGRPPTPFWEGACAAFS